MVVPSASERSASSVEQRSYRYSNFHVNWGKREGCEMKAVASMLVLALSSAAALQLPQAPASSVRRRSPPPSLNEAMTKDRIEKMIADNKVSRRVRTAASLVRRHR